MAMTTVILENFKFYEPHARSCYCLLNPILVKLAQVFVSLLDFPVSLTGLL
jgi:hypothetical protein